MREDPIITGGWIKAALVILVAGALGVGAYGLVSGVDINLPDLPDVNTGGATTSLSDTTLEGTTVGEQKPPAPSQPDQFTSAGLGSAIGKVRGEIGSGQQLTDLPSTTPRPGSSSDGATGSRHTTSAPIAVIWSARTRRSRSAATPRSTTSPTPSTAFSPPP